MHWLDNCILVLALSKHALWTRAVLILHLWQYVSVEGKLISNNYFPHMGLAMLPIPSIDPAMQRLVSKSKRVLNSVRSLNCCQCLHLIILDRTLAIHASIINIFLCIKTWVIALCIYIWQKGLNAISSTCRLNAKSTNLEYGVQTIKCATPTLIRGTF